MYLTSSAFAEGGEIPRRYTCEGEDVSPPLAWGGVPEGTRSFVLIADDPDAPGGVWVHWVLYDLPGKIRSLPEGNPASLGTRGTTDFRRAAYGGPCPPPGKAHRYFFTLYALDVPSLGLPEGASRPAVEQAMQGHILARAQWMGTYQR
jgi:Raf kinase inhibitor-like YbhB/YbcL family protein